MRYLIVRPTSLEQRFSLTGVDLTPVFEKKLNSYNTVIIDKSFSHDITLSFPEYIFEVNKILSSCARGRKTRIFALNNDFIYNKKVDDTIVNDLVIALRHTDFTKINIPYIDSSGRIRLVLSANSPEVISSIRFTRNIESYVKLRTIVFNTTILPYLKILIT